ncbi:hypothetical protein PMNALOAF_2745 [Methylobacterium adhaesivum]|uniref:Uncharacterized protein n=1 Tax=Methylobacterium adhaesivum TaxID=333297 RepID=A0ABT8BIV9_9HYPH|nr:hypothetical protein [Methylobacterium adhaesivum]MDN3592098.1 hypothetical protein [Methylobacterium adhaesivum]GJD31486.1 hypothetical protein PMNALOAF_2745 [Methylobacterium adhaesivum]
MIEWSTPEGHFATARIGAVQVAVVRRDRDHALAVYYLGERGTSRHENAEEARRHVEAYVAHWLLSAGLQRAPMRAAA